MRNLYALPAMLFWIASAAWGATYYVDGAPRPATDTSPLGTRERPWKTLAEAARSLSPGDTVLIQAGVYRETVQFKRGGAAGRPITLKAAPGQHVVLSGAERLTGWKKVSRDEVGGNPHAKNIRSLDLNWIPQVLYEGTREMIFARTPNEGWWAIKEGLDLQTFTDPVHLTQSDPDAWNGWTVALLDQAGGHVARVAVARFDPEKHLLKIARPYSKWRKKINPQRDRYYLENQLSTLDGPGQYVLKREEKGCRLYVWPSRFGPQGQPLIEAPRRQVVIDFTGISHLVLDGLEVAFSANHGIGMGRNKPTTDVRIQNCYIHHNRGYGIFGRGPTHMTIRRNLISHNDHGITLSGSQDSLVEENDIGWNRVDGMVAPSGTRRLTIRRNYFHDHYRWGHPDNLQFWKDVQDVTIDSNVFWNGGQGIMSAGMKDIKVLNNIFCGTHAIALILTRGEDFEVRQNTLCATGLQPTNFSRGKRYRLQGNLIAPLHPAPLYSVEERKGFEADYNLLWAGGKAGKCLVPVGRDWGASTLETLQKKTGLERHGIAAAPRFKNAPRYYTTSDYRRIAACTRSKFYLRTPHEGRMAVGDYVELDFDGVPRRITALGSDWFAVDKPLARLPLTIQGIADWGPQKDFTWDLRLAADSPARGAGPEGKDIGSSINLRAFRAGDFDGDGKRDVPEPSGNKRDGLPRKRTDSGHATP